MFSRKMRLAVLSSLFACPWTEGGFCLLVSDAYPDTQSTDEHSLRGRTTEDTPQELGW